MCACARKGAIAERMAHVPMSCVRPKVPLGGRSGKWEYVSLKLMLSREALRAAHTTVVALVTMKL